MVRDNYASRKGNILALLIIFVYLKHHMKRRIICDSRLLENQGEVNIELNCSYLYPGDVEYIPTNIPDSK